jgi:hypothetical protein
LLKLAAADFAPPEGLPLAVGASCRPKVPIHAWLHHQDNPGERAQEEKELLEANEAIA